MTASDAGSPAPDEPRTGRHQAGTFDIRMFIAMLIGLYGVVLVVMGLLGTPEEQLDRADGLNINLWAGLGMVVTAVLFVLWARLRPVVVPDHYQAEHTGTN